jgi:hypothetical protein
VCTGTCLPDDCVRDLEKLIWSVITRHMGGAKRRNGSLTTGGGFLSMSDKEELQLHLIAEAWREFSRYEARDDGDRRSRLTGYLQQRLHFRCTDFLRARYVNSRYGHKMPEIVSFNPALDQTEWWDEYAFEENGRHLDRDVLSPKALDQCALLELAIESEKAVGTVARELGVATSLDVLRREAVVRE